MSRLTDIEYTDVGVRSFDASAEHSFPTMVRSWKRSRDRYRQGKGWGIRVVQKSAVQRV